jgi:hypothetical protein
VRKLKMLLYYELENNSCEICGEKPSRACINEYRNKGRDFEEPILHYSCLEHALSIYKKLEDNRKEELVLSTSLN